MEQHAEELLRKECLNIVKLIAGVCFSKVPRAWVFRLAKGFSMLTIWYRKSRV